MSKRLVIHAGHGKTGTSYIQSFLELNAEVLAEQEIFYPLCGFFDGVKKVFLGRDNGQILFSDDFRVFRTTLLSSEFLFDTLLERDMVQNHLVRSGEEVIVVIYTRNLFELLTSAWAQYVKMGGGTDDVNQYLLFNTDFGFYKKTLNWILKSKEYGFKLIVRNYSNHKNRLVESFLESSLGSGILRSGIVLNRPKARTVNRSLTNAECFVQREFNKYLPNSSYFISSALLQKAPELKAETPSISRSAYDVAKQRHIQTIEEINNLIEHDERILCEDYNDLQRAATPESEFLSISKRQMEILIESISNMMNIMRNRSYSQFDPQVYLDLNPDVRNAGADPWKHFVRYGIEEGRPFKKVKEER